VSGESERVREKKKKANVIIWATTRGVVGTAQDHIVIHTGAESKASPTDVVVSGARNARMSDKVFIFFPPYFLTAGVVGLSFISPTYFFRPSFTFFHFPHERSPSGPEFALRSCDGVFRTVRRF